MLEESGALLTLFQLDQQIFSLQRIGELSGLLFIHVFADKTLPLRVRLHHDPVSLSFLKFDDSPQNLGDAFPLVEAVVVQPKTERSLAIVVVVSICCHPRQKVPHLGSVHRVVTQGSQFRVDQSVDSHDPPAVVDQRSAGHAPGHGGVGDHVTRSIRNSAVVFGCRSCHQAPRGGAHDPGRHRGPHDPSRRISERKDRGSDFRARGVVRYRKVSNRAGQWIGRAVDAKQRQVLGDVPSQNLGRILHILQLHVGVFRERDKQPIPRSGHVSGRQQAQR
mmetsp:Transcript_36227/g.77259  ORF Transcript_36227/g.77259 Transcript_36227/m.77259 type:complete len:277 (-) Transcript_36227:25-855(-)